MYIITDYYFLYGRFYPNKAKKVEPIEKPGDAAYESPEREKKGKRDFLEKGEKPKPTTKSAEFWI